MIPNESACAAAVPYADPATPMSSSAMKTKLNPMLATETSRLIAAMKPTRPSFRSASELTESVKRSGEKTTVICR